MDTLSDSLRAVRLISSQFRMTELSAPWSVRYEVKPDEVGSRDRQRVRSVTCHVIVQGLLWLSLRDMSPVELKAGEIVLLPRNDPHVLASEAGLAAISAGALLRPFEPGASPTIRLGGGGPATQIICGFLSAEESCNPLLSILPKLIRIDTDRGMSRKWIDAVIRFGASASCDNSPALSSVMTRLSEALLAEAIRQHATRCGHETSGGFPGLRDPHVGRALALLHQRTREKWTVEMLSRAAALSRSAFADRFNALVGTTPMRYLTSLRLRLARQKLGETTTSIAQLAHAVGYDSEVAFCRAFKREFGLTPTQWRMQAGRHVIG